MPFERLMDLTCFDLYYSTTLIYFNWMNFFIIAGGDDKDSTGVIILQCGYKANLLFCIFSFLFLFRNPRERKPFLDLSLSLCYTIQI
jgi:hypothetical protein